MITLTDLATEESITVPIKRIPSAVPWWFGATDGHLVSDLYEAILAGDYVDATAYATQLGIKFDLP